MIFLDQDFTFCNKTGRLHHDTGVASGSFESGLDSDPQNCDPGQRNTLIAKNVWRIYQNKAFAASLILFTIFYV